MAALKCYPFVFVLFLSILLSGCGGGGGGGNTSATSVNAASLPAIATVSALSKHYVKVSFNKAADPAADGNSLNYNIKISASGQAVPVAAATPSQDNTYVILEIAPTSEQLQQMAGGTLEFDLAGVNDTPIIFNASSAADPSITGVAAITDSTVSITFSEAVSDSAADVANYSITTSNGQTLAVSAASIGNFGDSVALTTAAQQDVTYTLKLKNITSKVSGLPIYPSGGGKTFLGMSLKTATSTTPKVVAAISTDNTHVTVTYNKPMGANAEDAANYSIVQVNVNSEVGMLGVTQAQFTNAEHTAVQLTTRSQNEVTYQVSAVNVSDSYGQQIGQQAGTNVLLATNSAQFAGTGPTANDLVDSDGDGLYDNEEELGYTIFIEMANGEVVARQVTSDPDKADTDGDGVNDADEKKYGTNPRASDTDADGLSDNMELNTVFSNPYAQDTDLDGLPDGLEHYSFHTSPLLADTDGDKLDDYTELFKLNRNPLVADLPKVQISVGDVRLQIDERYTYTDETGQTVSRQSSTNTTLSQSQDTSYSTGSSTVHEFSAGLSASFEAGQSISTGKNAGTQTSTSVSGDIHADTTNSWSSHVDQSSAKASQQAYEDSLTKGKTFNTNSTVTREVVGARMDVDLSIENAGNVPFSLSNLEITVLAPSPIDSNKYVPVATLVSNSQLITGTPLVVNLGPFNSKRGPFVFANTEIFPNLVEALMRNPRGLIFKIANYDVTDELGRNFAFTNQVARDRTAGVVIDLGDEAAATHQYVATSGAVDTQGYAGGNGTAYVGGFNADGSAKGLPLDYILQARLGLKRHDTSKDTIVPGPNKALDSTPAGDDVLVNGTITTGADGWLETHPAGDDYITNPTAKDGIVAGLNQTADSIAQGDDIQLVPVGTTGLSVGTVVIGAGDNGVLDTPALGDDKPDFVTGYETSRTCSATSPKAGQICRTNSDCSSTSSSTPGSCTGPQRLVRVNSLRNGDYNRAWFVMTSASVPAAADFGQITVKPGNDIILAFLQDLDQDGLFARDEYLAGSIDSSADKLDNSQFGVNFNIDAPPPCSAPISGTACDGKPDSQDSDRDGLGDFAEVRVGWKVAVDGGGLHQVYSNPALRDSDGDGLLDPEERDLRGYCAVNDPRKDGLCAFQSQPAVTKDKAIGIIAGANGKADSLAGDINGDGVVDASDVDSYGNPSDDVQLVAFGASGLGYGTPVIGPGANGKIETALRGDDVYESLSTVPPATDPSQADTDLDGVSDYKELTGYDVGLAIIDGGNGLADTTSNGDDVQKAPYGNPVTPGGIVILPGDNGVIDSYAAGDDSLRPAHSVTTDPLRRDTDNDTNPDGLEITLGSDPTVADGADFRDSDHDGLTDNEESSLGWVVTANGNSYLVKSSPSLPDTDGDGLPDFIERDLRTDPNKVDTDGDGISDYDEVQDFARFVRLMAPYPAVIIDGSSSMRYGSDPHKKDTDGDGLTDYQELIDGFYLTLPGDSTPSHRFTSPVLADTDADGLTDFAEVCLSLDPVPATCNSAYATDPTNNDTDGDGATDGHEESKAVGSNPLVPDLAVTLTFERVNATKVTGDGLNNDAEMTWWFTTKGPNDTKPVLLTSPENKYTGSTSVTWDYLVGQGLDTSVLPNYQNQCYEYVMNPGTTYSLNISNSSRKIILQPGQSFELNGLIGEIDAVSTDCGHPDYYVPTWLKDNDGCVVPVNKVFTYNDLLGNTGAQLLTATASNKSCSLDIQYTISRQ